MPSLLITDFTDTGTPGDFITADNLPTLSGTADETGDFVQISRIAPGAASITRVVEGGTFATSGAVWSFDLGDNGSAALVDGVYEFRVQTGSTLSPILTITIDTTALAPTILLNPFTPAPDGAGRDTDDPTPNLVGTGEIGAAVEIRIDGGAWQAAGSVDGGGNWSFTPGTALASGDRLFEVRQTDVAGNVSGLGSVTLDVNTPASGTVDVLNGVFDVPIGYVGTQLTLVRDLADPDGIYTAETVTVVWERYPLSGDAWEPISGATGLTYTPVEADVLGRIRAVLSWTDGGGAVEQVTSEQLFLIVPAAIATGPAVVGGTLVASYEMDFEFVEVTDQVQWQRTTDGGATWVNLPGATDFSYVPTFADAGAQLRVLVGLQGEGVFPVPSLPTAIVTSLAGPPSSLSVFGALTSDLGYELWVTDGTEAGTVLLADLNPGVEHSTPERFTALGDGRVLFVANGPQGEELWVTDGTAGGTTLVKDILPGSDGAGPADFFAMPDGRVLFRAFTGIGSELWVTDGTEAGTVLLKDIRPGEESGFPLYFASLGDGRIVFRANSPSSGTELWITDGTEAGTVQLLEIFPGNVGSDIAEVVSLGNGRVVFSAETVAENEELWVTDGSVAGTFLVRDIRPGTSRSDIDEMTFFRDGRALFAANDGVGGDELWITDGTTAGTYKLRELAPGSQSGDPDNFGRLGDGRFVFSATDGVNGDELWVTDGTEAGTFMLKDIDPGANGSFPDDPTTLPDGRVVFEATDGVGGREIWITDGTAAGTQLVLDINPFGDAYADSYARMPDGRLLFRADDGAGGMEPWVTDGTAAGTLRLRDIEPSSDGSFPYGFTIVPRTVDEPTTGAPAITGLAQPGATLLASRATLDDADGLIEPLAWRWQRADGQGGWVDIAGAIGPTYTLGAADLGVAVRAVASYADLQGGFGEAASEAVIAATTPDAPTPPAPSGLPVFYVTEAVNGFGEQVTAGVYSGPVEGLSYQFLGTRGGEAVVGTALADFVALGAADDAADGGAGDDVLDGGTGSNFLTGSAGRDVFFLDGRGAGAGAVTWSTITDWQAGEQLVLWGWQTGVSRAEWLEDAGAEGWRGTTMHADLDADGRIDTSVTFTGRSRADIPNGLEIVGESGGLLWFIG